MNAKKLVWLNRKSSWTQLTPVFVYSLLSLMLSGFMLANKSPWPGPLNLLVTSRLFVLFCLLSFGGGSTTFGCFFDDTFVAGWSLFSLLFALVLGSGLAVLLVVTLLAVMLLVFAEVLATATSFAFLGFSAGSTMLGRDVFAFLRPVRLSPIEQRKLNKLNLLSIESQSLQFLSNIYPRLQAVFRLLS